jgi:hypothetical protein
MPRRRRRPVTEEILAEHLGRYPCPANCPASGTMATLFGVLSYDLEAEFRVDGRLVPIGKQMINGEQMRLFISEFLQILGQAVRSGRINEVASLAAEVEKNPGEFIGLAMGCLSDLCFNLEYIRRATDHRWAYCMKHETPRVYYPYLGVCPYCITREDKMRDSALGVNVRNTEETDDDVQDRARYFGNKIQSHHVGRIGERSIVFLLDLLTKTHDPGALTALVTDDQFDVDAVFFFSGIATLAQIKASPLILLPLVAELPTRLTAGQDPDTGLPMERANHTFTDLTTATTDLHLYISLTDSKIPIGPKVGEDFPYTSFRAALNEEIVLQLLENWLNIYRAFIIPKVQRQGIEKTRAYLTAGWGAPIDDNKTKAGLARSDNMMKGTYACLKYGAYYVQECARGTLRASLVANIDPAHQYQEYLQKLEDIRWGHDPNFETLPPESPGAPVRKVIDSDKLTYLFDSVFTFNRQVLNDPKMREAWDLSIFAGKLFGGELDAFLSEWRVEEEL